MAMASSTPGSAMDHRHQRLGHLARLGVLDDIPAVYNSAGALAQNLQRALEDYLLPHAAAAARQHGTPGRLHQAMKLPGVGGRIALDQIGAQFRRLPHQVAMRPQFPELS